MKRAVTVGFAVLVLLAGCGGHSNPSPPPHAAHLAIYDWEPNVIGPNGRPLGPVPVDTSAAHTPLRTRTAALQRMKAARRAGVEATVLRAPAQHGWYVIQDRPELTTADITKPSQNFDPRTSEPIVVFHFTPHGRAAFSRLTARVAQRGEETILPPGFSRFNAFQHIAIAVDGQIRSLAYIDFIQNPKGVDGKTGAQISGIGTITETQRLATALRLGAQGG